MNDYQKENLPRNEQDEQPLPQHIHDETNGLDYTLVDGWYYLPDLEVQDEGNQHLGRYGLMRQRYLKEYRKTVYTTLKTEGKLFSHLREIDQQASGHFELLVRQLAEKENITELLKATDQMAWVGAMNNIRNRANEIVTSELIYT